MLYLTQYQGGSVMLHEARWLDILIVCTIFSMLLLIVRWICLLNMRLFVYKFIVRENDLFWQSSIHIFWFPLWYAVSGPTDGSNSFSVGCLWHESSFTCWGNLHSNASDYISNAIMSSQYNFEVSIEYDKRSSLRLSKLNSCDPFEFVIVVRVKCLLSMDHFRRICACIV